MAIGVVYSVSASFLGSSSAPDFLLSRGRSGLRTSTSSLRAASSSSRPVRSRPMPLALRTARARAGVYCL
eukprot:128781-Rhodomonas_salina.1